MTKRAAPAPAPEAGAAPVPARAPEAGAAAVPAPAPEAGAAAEPASAPDAGAAAERYLAEVSARLPGSARTRSAIVAELRSGLLDAIDDHRSGGLPAAAATRTAISEFGDPAQVADGFTAEIAARLARRVALAMLVTGPLVGVLWIVTAASGQLVPHLPWAGLPLGIRIGAGLVAVAAAVTAWGALVGIAATGRLTRWLPVRPRRAPAAAAVAGFGAVGADALGLALLAVQLMAAPAALSPLPAAAAAAASLIRLVLARRAARRCLAIRATLA